LWEKLNEKVVLEYKIENEKEFQELFLDISINVTTFFRNPSTFTKLKSILSNFQTKTSIKIWSAGSSSGEEAYTIAIILQELGLLHKSLIYATDINELILQKAKNGIFSKENYNIFKQHYLQYNPNGNFDQYFNLYDDFVIIKQYLKSKILFFKHNLASDSSINEFDIILCRNVIIYFDEILKHKVFHLFKDSLKNNGYLILGESEYLPINGFITIDKNQKIYKKESKI